MSTRGFVSAIAALVVLAAASMASATDRYFNVASGAYESASSWSNNVVPTTNDVGYIGSSSGSGNCTATLSSAVSGSPSLYLGSGSGKNGQLDLLNGASLQVTSLRVGSDGTGTLTIANGASVAATGGIYVGTLAGSSGSVTQTGGTLSMSAGWSRFIVGATGTGSYHLVNGTISTSGYSTFIGNVPGGDGVFTQDGGLVQLNGEAGILSVGYAGIGRYEMKGGALVCGANLAVGCAGYVGSAFVPGQGTFTQTGGAVTANGGDIGNGGTGVYNISAGTFTSTGTTAIGANGGLPGSGTLHQTGGTVETPLVLGNLSATTGVYTLDNGTLNSSGITVGGAGAGTFNQNGGMANLTGSMNGTGTLNLAGGTLNMNTYDVSIANANLTGGTLMNGGTISTNACLGANSVAFHEGNDFIGVVTGVLSDVSGVAGSLTKTGTGWLILNGANTYTGKTTVQAGMLQMNAAAYATVLAHTADVQGGQLLFNYSETSTPVAALRSSLHSGAIYTSTGAAQGCGVGYSDDGVGLVTAKVALLGDTDMGGIVNNDDLARLLSALGGTDCVWTQGDFNYDSKVNNDDLAMLLSNLGKSFAGFGSAKAQALGGAVPEPSTLVLLTAGLLGLAAYAWRKRK